MADQKFLTHYDLALWPDPSRTVLKAFDPGDPPDLAKGGQTRAQRIAQRVLALDDAEVKRLATVVSSGLSGRHRDLPSMLQARFDDVKVACAAQAATAAQASLIALYFVEEYSFEAAALFNPSIVPLPDQAGCPAGGLCFALSLRGIGEGHISTVTFRTGSWVPGAEPIIDEPSKNAASPIIEGDTTDDEAVIKLRWTGIGNLSEAVLYPVLPRHRQGLEDARFVRFVEEDGRAQYYATVTANSGSGIREELICAGSLEDFELHPMTGSAANKGMALFPRRIDGRYMMLGRQDNENLWLLHSDDLFVWDEATKLLAPKWPWEFVQIGNCGSPIEIDEGWLVLTHGVGPARTYCIGACLLDRNDPAKVLGRMTLPLLHPSNQERDGYVPNVVYSCGGLVHDRTLLLPYGIADSYTRFVSGSVDDIVAALQ